MGILWPYCGADKNIGRANFQQKSFLATFTMDVFFNRCSLWDIHTFSNYRKWNVIFMNNLWHFDVFGGIFISPEPFIVWSRATPHFNQKTQLMRVIQLKYIIIRTWSGLKLLFLTKMANLGQFVYFSYHYLYEITLLLKLIRKS